MYGLILCPIIKSFGKHHIDAVFGSEFTRYVQEGFYASREGLYLEDRDFAGLSVATGDEIDVSSSADEYTYFSLFAKANYSYAGKYLLSATVRRDGSSYNVFITIEQPKLIRNIRV